MKTLTRIARAASAAVAVAVLVTAASQAGWAGGGGEKTRMRANLSGPSINSVRPEGNADFRSEPSHGRTGLKVEVEQVNLPDGTTLSVALQRGSTNMSIGSITLAAGFGELEFRSQDGDSVPAVQAGDVVIVVGAEGAILSGVF